MHMLSESARMSSAGEARYRIPVPPPTARIVKVLALDPAADVVVHRLAERAWTGTMFLSKPAADAARPDLLSGRLIASVLDEIASSDLVVMVVAAGADARLAAPLGAACSDRGVTAAACVVGAGSATHEALTGTLAQVRPWSQMVIVASDDGYVEDLLRSLR